MQIANIQFITNYQSRKSHFQQVKEAVAGGIKWIQYRPKYQSLESVLAEGKQIADFCKEHSVVFIMNDMVDMAIELNADGVHLGKNDSSPLEARKLLGNDKIIGGTANTMFYDWPRNDTMKQYVVKIAECRSLAGLNPHDLKVFRRGDGHSTASKNKITPLEAEEEYFRELVDV